MVSSSPGRFLILLSDDFSVKIMESVSSRGGDPVVKPSMEVWHFQIAVYFAFGFFFLRLVLDRYVFQVSHYFFEFMTEAFIASLVLNSPC